MISESTLGVGKRLHNADTNCRLHAMSKRLLDKVNQLILEKGKNKAMAQLCGTLNKCERTIQRWIKEGPPTAHDALCLARACGTEDGEAQALARECFPEAMEQAS